MVYFKSLNARVSVLFTIPLGFATGMLAATIAVGGFIGVPAMHYVLGAPALMASATELVTAFVMGVGGSMKYAWSGLVDIRLAMIILAGSLFGIQLGAIGTTYVKPHMIKMVMGVIMVLVMFSRAIAIPVYLSELDLIDKLAPHLPGALLNISFVVLIAALASGAAIVFAALWTGISASRREAVLATSATTAFSPDTVASPATPQLSPLGRFERFLLATDGSEYSAGAVREALRMASKCGARLRAVSVVAGGDAELYAMGEQLIAKELNTARAYLDDVQQQAASAGVACESEATQGNQVYQEIVSQAEKMQADLIIMGRRGRHGLARLMVGPSTVRVIGHARATCSWCRARRSSRDDASLSLPTVRAMATPPLSRRRGSQIIRHAGHVIASGCTKIYSHRITIHGQCTKPCFDQRAATSPVSFFELDGRTT